MNDQNELETITPLTEQTISDENLSRNDFNRLNGSKPPGKSNKKIWIVLLVVIVIIGGVFYYMNRSSSDDKKNTKSTVSSTTYTLSKEDEDKIGTVVKHFSEFYEDSKRTKLKPNIDTEKLKPLKKDIDSVSDKTLKNEFLRLYKQLETDIKNGSESETNSLESSSSSIY